jgi:hypothetical protein
VLLDCCLLRVVQAFINTAREIYKKIQDGVFDVSNEVRQSSCQHAGKRVGCEHLAAWLTDCVGMQGGSGPSTDVNMLPNAVCWPLLLLCSRTESRLATVQAAPAHKTSSRGSRSSAKQAVAASGCSAAGRTAKAEVGPDDTLGSSAGATSHCCPQEGREATKQRDVAVDMGVVLLVPRCPTPPSLPPGVRAVEVFTVEVLLPQSWVVLLSALSLVHYDRSLRCVCEL